MDILRQKPGVLRVLLVGPVEGTIRGRQMLALKSAVMGRAKVLYGPIRELALQRVPGIGGEQPVNFLQLNRNLEAYLKRIRRAPETEPAESEAFFRTPEMQKALPVPRFLEQQLLVHSPWRREGMGEGLVRRILEYYQEHADIPRAGEVIAGLEGDLRLCEAKRWSREDGAADPEGIPDDARLTLCYRPFFRWWLNTAFYTARDPESGTPLLEYLEKYLPYQASWSHRFALRENGTPRTIAAAGGTVEIDGYPLHLEYRLDGKPAYRPCLTWEQTARESGDWFALLLPITAAPYSRFPDVAREIQSRLDDFPILREDLDFVARCLAGHVCRLPLDRETGQAVPPEKAFPLELSMEGGGKLYTAEWMEDGPITIYRQTFSGRRIQERLLPDPEGNWVAAPGLEESVRRSGVVPPVSFTADSGLEAARRRLAELTDPRFFDLSRLRELPWHVYYTTVGGVEGSLTRPDLQRDEPRQDAWALLEQWGGEDIPPDLEAAAARMQQAIREAAPEEPEPQESPVTGEALSALLYNFSQGEVNRLELEWSQGRLVLCHDKDKYACLYFENSYGRGENWYALLADAEMYRTIDCNDVACIPFGMGKLASVRVSWTFHPAEGGTERKLLVLLQDRGKYMMFWLEDGDRRALAYASDEPRWFLGRALPACLVHEDLKRLRNGIDLLLDDIDNTEPVLSQPGRFAEVRADYEELRTALVHET